jgi:hypothetical protein
MFTTAFLIEDEESAESTTNTTIHTTKNTITNTANTTNNSNASTSVTADDKSNSFRQYENNNMKDNNNNNGVSSSTKPNSPKLIHHGKSIHGNKGKRTGNGFGEWTNPPIVELIDTATSSSSSSFSSNSNYDNMSGRGPSLVRVTIQGIPSYFWNTKDINNHDVESSNDTTDNGGQKVMGDRNGMVPISLVFEAYFHESTDDIAEKLGLNK